MKLKIRLPLILLGCGLVPTIIGVSISSLHSESSIECLSQSGADSLRERSLAELEASREAKKAHVLSYFETVRKQILTFSENLMVKEAMSGLPMAIESYIEEMKLDEAALAKLREGAKEFYEGEFSTAYRARNAGETPDADLAGLGDLAIALQHHYIFANEHPIGAKKLLNRADTVSAYSELHADVHPILRDYLETFGYEDIYLIEPDSGTVVYSVQKAPELGTSLLSGPFQETNLGDAFREAVGFASTGEFVMVDYARYTPAFGSPAFFIASPIFDGEDRLGVAAFRIPVGKVSSIVGDRAGLGETGETVLFGPDGLMRSDSFRDPVKHSVSGSFRDPENGGFDAEIVRAAFEQKKSGTDIVTDYSGNESLISWTPVKVNGLEWCVASKMDTAEALAGVAEIRREGAAANHSRLMWDLGIVISTALMILLLAVFVSGMILNPVNRTVVMVKDIAQGEGDLTRRLNARRSDELGVLAHWFNVFVDKLQHLIADIGSLASTLASSAGDLLAFSNDLTEGSQKTKEQSANVASAAEEMSVTLNDVSRTSDRMTSSLREVSTSVMGMSESIIEVASNAEETAKVTQMAAELTSQSNREMNRLADAAGEIGRVIETIQDIAEQTNLLALNATIEAARAGEAGRGFSVVASEVKNLARQTSDATEDIRQRIERIQRSTEDALESNTSVGDVVDKVNRSAGTIAAAVTQQQTATESIAGQLGHAASAFESVTEQVAQTASSGGEITRNISNVDTRARETASVAKRTQDAGQQLADLSEQLLKLVGQFKVS